MLAIRGNKTNQQACKSIQHSKYEYGQHTPSMNQLFSMEMTLHSIILPHHLRPALSAEGDAIKSIDLVPAGCDLFYDLGDPIP